VDDQRLPLLSNANPSKAYPGPSCANVGSPCDSFSVAPGHTSRHSIGGPEAPGAYDAVVDHLPLSAAAEKLRKSGGPFARVLAEGAHGSQGAHLHVELIKNAPAQQAAPPEAVEDTIYLRAVNGKRNPELMRRRGSGAATD